MNFALFENTLCPNGESLIFHGLEQEVRIFSRDELDNAYQKIHQLSQSNYFLIGYIAYDLAVLEYSEKPLVHFMAFNSLTKCNHTQLLPQLAKLGLLDYTPQQQQITSIESELNHADFFKMFEQVQENLRQGNSYQINLTERYKLDMSEIKSFDLYYQLSRANPVTYASYCSFTDVNVISISPELFFQKQHDKLITKPMKGTIARGNTIEEDKANKNYLTTDNKNRAENLIIVDLLRNDLAKIAKTNSVKVNKLFNIEEYQTVLQMTSEIEATVEQDIPFKQIITSLFPCGSITGAPKKRTIELIEQIEQSPRNIYTGAIGYLLPNNDMLFNVAIRTITKYNDSNLGVFGAGGGITIQSQATDELNEIYTKIKFITNHYQPDFKLVESILISNNQLVNLEQHLTRLKNSAEKLLFPCDIHHVKNQILHYTSQQTLVNNTKYKLRLELDYQNNILIEHSQIENEIKPKNIALLDRPIDTTHFLFTHKTTASATRGLYNKLYNEYLANEIDELIFVSQAGEITESRYFNLVIEINGKLLTPSVKCGLLAGIYRQNLIETKQAEESIINAAMLEKADKIYLCNDVRGMIECNYLGRISS